MLRLHKQHRNESHIPTTHSPVHITIRAILACIASLFCVGLWVIAFTSGGSEGNRVGTLNYLISHHIENPNLSDIAICHIGTSFLFILLAFRLLVRWKWIATRIDRRSVWAIITYLAGIAVLNEAYVIIYEHIVGPNAPWRFMYFPIDGGEVIQDNTPILPLWQAYINILLSIGIICVSVRLYIGRKLNTVIPQAHPKTGE
jgi:hypothetical protein